MNSVRRFFERAEHYLVLAGKFGGLIAFVSVVVGVYLTQDHLRELKEDIDIADEEHSRLTNRIHATESECKELRWSVQATNEKFSYLRGEIDENHPR